MLLPDIKDDEGDDVNIEVKLSNSEIFTKFYQ